MANRCSMLRTARAVVFGLVVLALPLAAQDVRPIPLPDLLVTGRSICPTTPEDLRQAFELYEAVLPGPDVGSVHGGPS